MRKILIILLLHPESQSIRPTYDETYDKIAVKTVSKCLARMKGCWDPEFKPSVEEIMDYRYNYGDSLSLLSLASSYSGGFPYSV